jgi:tRNA (guanine37-N1)-methyltransferase
MITFHIITLFPEAFTSYIESSIIKRAIESKCLKVITYNPRDFVPRQGSEKQTYADRRVDDRPYGGGPGMVIEALPVIRAIAKAKRKAPQAPVIFFTPSGELFTQAMARQWAGEGKKSQHLILVCGRYEGIDVRVKEVFPTIDISIGDFILTGGELPALVVLDAVARHVPGVLGDFQSREETRAASDAIYTRPETFTYKGKKYEVPKVLLNGNHKAIEEWRKAQKG